MWYFADALGLFCWKEICVGVATKHFRSFRPFADNRLWLKSDLKFYFLSIAVNEVHTGINSDHIATTANRCLILKGR